MAGLLKRLWLVALPCLLAVLALTATADARRARKGKKPTRTAQAAPAPSPVPAPTGAIVVAVGEAAQVHARELARVVYVDAALRPAIEEATAQVLSGGEAPADDATLIGHAAVVRAIGETKDEEPQRRLAGGLGRDLNARLVVLVSVPPVAEGVEPQPVARIVRMPEEQLLALTITPTRRAEAPAGEGAGWDWSGGVTVLQDLSVESAPKPKPKPKPKRPTRSKGQKPAKLPKKIEDSEDDTNLLTSPWFWGGLGLVVTVGVTVLILSQTALNEPDVVAIDGRVSP